MTGRLLIDHQRGLDRAALLDDHNQLTGLWVSAPTSESLAPGAIVQGRVEQHFPSLNKALVAIPDIGDVQLSGRDVPQQGADQPFPVQITAAGQTSRHPGVPAKHPRASTRLSWASRYLVYIPAGRAGVQTSKRATGLDHAALEEMLKAYPGQWIIRQRAAAIDHDRLAATAAALYAQAQAVLAQDAAKNVLQPGLSAAEAALLEMAPEPSTLVLHPDGEAATHALSVAQECLGLTGLAVETETGLFETLDVETAITALMTPVVAGEGFRLVIEPTEAMVVMDIDLAQPDCLDAALMASWRQISLRNLSGTIMLDVPRQDDWQPVKQRLTVLTADHSQPVTVQVMPGPGLVALSIPRRRPMLHEVLASEIRP